MTKPSADLQEIAAMAKMTSLRKGTPTNGRNWLVAALLGATTLPVWALTLGDGDQYAWSESSGWLNFNSEHSATPVQVFPDRVEGEVWHENLGWITLAGTAANGEAFGVAHDGAGHLSGFAWSESAGWINFASANGGGVTIDLNSGVFSGLAWGENFGWISLGGTAGNTDTYGVALAEEAGACGAANGVATLHPPTTGLCDLGTASVVTTANGTHHWTCAGVAGGTEAECSAPGSSSGDGGSVTFVTTAGGCSVESASIVAPPGGGPVGFTMPYDAITFSLRGCTGTSATVQLTFSGPVEGQEYWKYIDGVWVQMTSGVTLAGNTATIVIADNGPYDANKNPGIIEDPSGPAQRNGPGPVPIPTLSTWGLLLTAGVLGFLGTWRRRRAGVAGRA